MLPRTDLVCLLDQDKPSEAVVVRLRDAIKVVGSLISPTEHPLIRLLVHEFPSENQLAELRKYAFKR